MREPGRMRERKRSEEGLKRKKINKNMWCGPFINVVLFCEKLARKRNVFVFVCPMNQTAHA